MSIKSAIAPVVTLFLICFCAGPSNANPTTYSDDTFENADWTGSIIAQTGPPASFSSQQSANGGNPGAYRRLQHTYGGVGSIVTEHLLDEATYDPGALGAIANLTFSFELIGFDFGGSGAVGYGGLIFQNDSYYGFGGNAGTIFGPNTGVWENHLLPDLVASDFNRISGPGPDKPNFSASASEIQFGYFGSNGTSNNPQSSTDSGIDNWSVTIQAVPEPSTATLLKHGSSFPG